MLPNTLNSKINLPSVVSQLGGYASDYEFFRMPTFGWFAKGKNSGFIGNIFDFFEKKDWSKLLGTLCKDFSNCMEFNVPYNEHAEKQLYKNQMRNVWYEAFWKMSVEGAAFISAREGSKVTTLGGLLRTIGMPALLDNGIGYVTEKNIARMPANIQAEISAKLVRYKKTIIIPSFCTPKHMCSLEIARLGDLGERQSLLHVGEFGWYGQIGQEIVKDIHALKIAPGCTWNSKLKYWLNTPVQLSEHLQLEHLIRIWSESQGVAFTQDLESLLLSKTSNGELKDYIATLTHQQILDLEKASGQVLMPAWLASKEQQFVILGKTYVKRDKAYFLQRNSGEEQLTNFSLDVHKICKKENDEFIWCGNIYFQDQTVPFELPDKHFSSCYLFARGIRKVFLSLGIGIPYINESHTRGLLAMIQISSQNVPVVNS